MTFRFLEVLLLAVLSKVSNEMCINEPSSNQKENFRVEALHLIVAILLKLTETLMPSRSLSNIKRLISLIVSRFFELFK